MNFFLKFVNNDFFKINKCLEFDNSSIFDTSSGSSLSKLCKLLFISFNLLILVPMFSIFVTTGWNSLKTLVCCFNKSPSISLLKFLLAIEPSKSDLINCSTSRFDFFCKINNASLRFGSLLS